MAANVVELDNRIVFRDEMERVMLRMQEKIYEAYDQIPDAESRVSIIDSEFRRMGRLLDNFIVQIRQKQEAKEERSKPLPRRLLALKTFQLRGIVDEIHARVDLEATDDPGYELAVATEKLVEQFQVLERVIHKLQDNA